MLIGDKKPLHLQVNGNFLLIVKGIFNFWHDFGYIDVMFWINILNCGKKSNVLS